MQSLDSSKIATIGFGYVGQPLAVELSKRYDEDGFDVNTTRIDELRRGHDHTLEVDVVELAAVPLLSFSGRLAEIASCDDCIVTVPTPIDSVKRPDLTPLIKASDALDSILKHGDVMIYESTVYPGCTEEACVPLLERTSGLNYNTHVQNTGHRTPNTESPNPEHKAPNSFSCGYSPLCIDPGDKPHRVTTILKLTSSSTPEIADFVERLYGSLITAGVHQASCIKVAEAAKLIGNTQRDLNSALVDDLAILSNKLGIDTLEVLEAAGTYCNFLPFRPGLVGGHFTSVAPYYLTHKAQEVGHHPVVTLAGRWTFKNYHEVEA